MVAKLVACLVLGGVMLSIALGWLEASRSRPVLQMELTQHLALSLRSLQSLIRGTGIPPTGEDLAGLMGVFAADSSVVGLSLTPVGGDPVRTGRYDPAAEAGAKLWVLPEHALALGDEVDLTRPTLVRAPFLVQDRPVMLEVLVDGPAAGAAMHQRVLDILTSQWLLLSATTLMGLLLLRRWFASPLSRIVGLTGRSAGPESFYEVARSHPGEFGQLAEAIGGMLTRLECTTERLRQRERAFENLYQFAPAAMVSLDGAGQIVEANCRAAELLGARDERTLIGLSALDFIRTEDRGRLRQAIDRLDLAGSSRCELRLQIGSRSVDALVECAGVRDEDGQLKNVRLSLLDVTQSKRLQRELANQTRLLNLVLDHMSDAILLVDSEGKVAAHNRQLAALVHRRRDAIDNQPYDAETFWEEMGLLNRDLFVDRLKQIDADHERPAQERFEARVGTFLFQGIPVQDALGAAVGRLWVVQEITSQEQSQRLLSQQSSQLNALRQIGQDLAKLESVDDLITRAANRLYEVFGVEAVGVALRDDRAGVRSMQVLHRGHGPMLLDQNRELVACVEKHLMPMILGAEQVTFWPDLPARQPWVRAFEQAGLTSLAGGPLRGGQSSVGVLWIARRGGERLERHHIHLVEALAPVIAARLEVALTRHHLLQLELSDPVTNLPNSRRFEMMLRKLANRPGHRWSLAAINLDRFRAINQDLSHATADELLRMVANIISKCSRPSAQIARLDGPTFAVACPGMDVPEAVTLAQRLREAIAAVPVPGADPGAKSLTASIGVAGSPEDGETPSAVLAAALTRVEIAKRTGTDRVVACGVAQAA